MYYVTGSNIFGQWLIEDFTINQFRTIGESKLETSISINQSKLLQIHWSYNIIQTESNFYVTGYWGDKESQVVKIPIPTEYKGSNEDLILAGNDYNIIIISKDLSILWVTDLSLEKEFKKIYINAEEPIENVEKKQKSSVTKVKFVNNSCLYLTSTGRVYSGILPSYVDTRHCRGKVCEIQCGYEHNALLTDVGSVYTWGNGRRLQLGHGDVSNLELPTEVEALSGIKITSISCGGWHTLALSEFGDLYAWGWNDTGQLGIKHDKEIQSYPVPTLVDLFDSNGEEVTINIKDIGCGSRHSAIILEDNSVWTTGCNKYGQLGLPKDEHSTVNYFHKAFQCDNSSVLKCGPWTTVIVTR